MPQCLKAVLDSMHELGNHYPAWLEKQLDTWERRTAGTEPARPTSRREFQNTPPSANAALPDHYNPFIHERMLAAARLDTTIVKEATTGFRVKGNMPHTEFYDIAQEDSPHDHCEEELELALRQGDEKLKALLQRDNSTLEVGNVLGLTEEEMNS